LKPQIFGKLWEFSKESRSDRRFSRSANPQASSWPSSLKKALQAFEFRESTYLALMEVLLERISPTSLSREVVEGGAGGVEARVCAFKNSEFLAPIFELLCLGGQLDLQKRALRDFATLISKVCARIISHLYRVRQLHPLCRILTLNF
jgi:hypothetical protein